MQPRVLLIHDRDYFAETRAEILSRLYDIPTKALTTALEALEFINKKRLRGVDCAIVHFDLGLLSQEGSGLVYKVVEAIHEVNETVRIGITSRNFPYGVEEIKELKADFYFPVGMLHEDNAWYLEQLRAGPVLPDEIRKRGKEIVIPPVGTTHPERVG